MLQALYCWTSDKGKAHTHYIHVYASDVCASMEHIYTCRAIHLLYSAKFSRVFNFKNFQPFAKDKIFDV